MRNNQGRGRSRDAFVINFMYTSLLGFVLYKYFVKKHSCLFEIPVLWGISLWRILIQ